MNDIEQDVQRFRAEKRIDNMMVFGLNVLREIKDAQDSQMEKLSDSLEEIEAFLLEKHGIQIDLAHLAKHAEYLDETQAKSIRKRFLDYGGMMRREL